MKKIILLGVAVVVGGCAYFLYQNKNADEYEGRFLLKNIAMAERAYSVATGGGGKTMFTDDLTKLEKYASDKAINAARKNNPTAWKGYLLEIRESLSGDKYQNDFLVVAYPAPGYNGKTMQISKSETIIIK